MSRYSVLVSLHLASVIVWLGCGTALAFVAVSAQRARGGVVLGQLGALVRWHEHRRRTCSLGLEALSADGPSPATSEGDA